MKTYQIVIEKWDEEFETIDETNDLEEAIEKVKKVPIESYKAIMLWKVDKKGKVIKEIEVEIR